MGCPATEYCPTRTRFAAVFFVDPPTVLTTSADDLGALLPLTIPIARPAARADRRVADTVTPFCFLGGMMTTFALFLV